MKPLTSHHVMTLMDEDDWGSFHDVVYDAASLSEGPDREVLEQVLHRLDDGILCDAVKWGMSDTGVRENAYEEVQREVQKHGSLDAWFAASKNVDSDN